MNEQTSPDLGDVLPVELGRAVSRDAARLGCFTGRIRYIPTVSSTSDVAAALAADGAPDGTTVVAGAQTAGRGRHGRTWSSPPGAGLYASVILRPPRHVPLLTLMAGVALAEAVRGCTSLPIQLKWPNDLVIAGPGIADASAHRKIGGILAEASGPPESSAHVIVGFGINLGEADWPADVAARATSLEAELASRVGIQGRNVDLATLLVESLAALARWRDTLMAGRTDAILTRWRELSPSCDGAQVEVHGADGPRGGITAGIDETGALRVRTGDTVERVIAGEIRWL